MTPQRASRRIHARACASPSACRPSESGYHSASESPSTDLTNSITISHINQTGRYFSYISVQPGRRPLMCDAGYNGVLYFNGPGIVSKQTKALPSGHLSINKHQRRARQSLRMPHYRSESYKRSIFYCRFCCEKSPGINVRRYAEERAPTALLRAAGMGSRVRHD